MKPMDPDLTKLIEYAGACAASLKGAVDAYVNSLSKMKQQSLKCEADLREKQSKANAEIDRLRAEMKSLADEKAYLERTLSSLKDQQESVRKSIQREKSKMLGDLDAFLAKA
jgi:predicted  nucleic acid-binding Zn-ribbon protein